MKASILLPVVNGVIVAGLLAGLGAMSLQKIDTPHVKEIEQLETLATGLAGMATSAEKNLGKAEALESYVARMRVEPKFFGADPFALQQPPESETASAEEKTPAAGEEKTPAPAAVAEQTPDEVPEEKPQPVFPPESMDLYRVRDANEWPTFKLTGTVVAGDKSLAIINGEVYRIKSIVEGLQVRSIRKNEVILASPILGEVRRVVME